MKKLLLGLMMLLAFGAFAQSTHTVDFETAATGSGWSWTTFEVAPALTEMANPVSGGINTSATVMEFVAHATDQPWTGCWTTDDGVFTFDATNAIVKMMVYKPIISEVHFKVEGGTGPVTELVATNTVVNQWEELTFDFSAVIGQSYGTLVIFPDFNFSRTTDVTCYFDNIQVPDGVVTGPLPEPTTIPPTPPHASADVISVYSDTYTNLAGTDFNPNWGQSTAVTVDYVAAGNNTLKYENLNYQGTQYTNQNVSLFEYLHVDYWTPNSTTLDFYLISPGAETYYSLPITLETWGSVDILLTDFVPPVDLANVFQFKVVGNNTVYFDNIYFWKNPTTADATLSDLQVDGTTIAGFNPNILDYTYELPAGSAVPTVTATTNDPSASHVVNPAASVPGTTEVVVTASDLTTQLTYSVDFVVVPVVAAPTPTQDPANVISMFSDAYTDVAVDTWLTSWSQGVLEDVLIDGNPTKKYSEVNFVGVETTGPNLIDATSMTHFHMDVWTPDANDFKIKLVDFGADGAYGGGDDSEHELTFAAPATGTWISYDIPLADFTGLASTEHLAQLIMVKAPLGTLFIDNVFYYVEAAMSTAWTGNIDNNWNDAGNWSDGIPTATTDVTIPSGLTNYPTISTAAECNTITVESGASLLDNGLLIVNSITVERDYSGNQWHLIGSPVTGETANTFFGLYLQSHDETVAASSGLSYSDVTDETTVLEPGQGYALWNQNGTATASYSGSLTWSATRALTRSGAGNIDWGWNLVSNPYPSSVDWNAVSGWTKTNVDASTYRFDGAGTGNWAVWNGTTGTNAATQFIASGQGFFVAVTDNGSTTGSLGFTNDVRVHDNTSFYKEEPADIVKLKVSGNNYSDEAAVYFREEATTGFDGQMDAYNLSSFEATAPDIYSTANGGMAINVLPQVTSVPMNVTVGSGSGTFTIETISNGEFNELYLEDLATGTVTNLNTDSYTFDYIPGLDSRFVLHFGTLGIGDEVADLYNVYSYNKDVYVAVPENTSGTITVYDMMGKEVANSSINGTLNTITLEKSAYYVVKVLSNKNIITEKVFIK